MAKFKIGEGIRLEAKVDMQPAKVEYKAPEKVEIKCQDCSKLKEQMKKANENIAINRNTILDVMDNVNKIDMRPVEIPQITQPEVKSVTIHRNHTKDFEDVYQKMHIEKSEMQKKINNLKEDINKQNKINKIQKIMNICLAIGGVCSLLAHLI